MLTELEIDYEAYRRQCDREERIRRRTNEWKRVLREGKADGSDTTETNLRYRHTSRSVQDVKENTHQGRQPPSPHRQKLPEISSGRFGRRDERAELVQNTRRSLKFMQLDEASAGSKSSRRSKPSEKEVLVREQRLERARQARMRSGRHRALDVEIAAPKTLRSAMGRASSEPKTTVRSGLTRYYSTGKRPTTPTRRYFDNDGNVSTPTKLTRYYSEQKEVDDADSVYTRRTATSETMSLVTTLSETLSSVSAVSRDEPQKQEEQKAKQLEKQIALEVEMAAPKTPFVPSLLPRLKPQFSKGLNKVMSSSQRVRGNHSRPKIVTSSLPPPPPPPPPPSNLPPDDSSWHDMKRYSYGGCFIMDPQHIKSIYELLEGRYEI